ncbi:Wzz/FepE/Etk N-terminal domain-containing protein [Salipiger sp. P9]|uniref:GumC family protein n=1 Tax=Salipiger pentaromativorans TaxID=2943193 RepID=UPI002157FA85|nr:Wzz/FepE/Etk N-terminal domain-containing protein [Salipiger pentaromativorans]MCR8549100.1 Wzz/FepE/Etk N-terminal domain-containing protein [Salipiger pentaromativorans]
MNQFQSIGEVFAALRRRTFLIFFVTLLGCALSVWIALNQTKTYEATAVVQIEEAQVPDSLAGATAQGEDAARRVRLIEQRLMSRDNLVRIMEDHALFTSDPDMTINERVFHMRQSVRIEEIRANPNAFQATQEAPSGLLITVTLDDPQKAADLANQLMHTMIDQSRSRSAGRARETLSFFEGEAARVEAEIEEMDARVAAYKRENASALPGGLISLRDQLTTLQDNELELDREIVAMEANSSRQREEVLARQVTLMREQRALVQARIAEIQDTILRAPEVERELNGLERSLSQLQDQYSVITRRKAEAEMGQMLEDRQQMDRFEVLETALVPEVPSSRSRKKVATMGAVASVIAGIAAAFIIELMNPAIRSAAQMERALGMQPVVAIPPIRSRRDRRRKGLGIFASLALLAASVWAVIRFAGDRIPWQALVEKLLPRTAQP